MFIVPAVWVQAPAAGVQLSPRTEASETGIGAAACRVYICASEDVGVLSVGCSDLSLCSGVSALPANVDKQLLVFHEDLCPSALG